MFTIEAR